MARFVTMRDPLTKSQRSALMSKVKSTGNRSTEAVVEGSLRLVGISGWVRHPRRIPGRPDFYFRQQRLALFIDGCFWHGCSQCGRLPKSRVGFWKAKIDGNRRRDAVVRRDLRLGGYRILRIWEHDLKSSGWLRKVQARLGALTSPPKAKRRNPTPHFRALRPEPPANSKGPSLASRRTAISS